MGGRYCAINAPLGPRWGQKSLDLRSRDFCPHLEPRGELIAQYRPPISFRYRMPRDLTDDKSTLVQVMAWCRQATSHYLNQYWPISPTSYGVTRPQLVKWYYISVMLERKEYNQSLRIVWFKWLTAIQLCNMKYISCWELNVIKGI